MLTWTRAYLLSKLTDGEGAMVERLEAEVRRAIVQQHGAPVIKYPMPSHVSEQTARTLMELYVQAGWRAMLVRRDGLTLVLTRPT